ncbi:beta strand repeat-containing protein, partial [Pedobacter miscanthi]|uniref:beta strand repeat-containing protein n=1 Tax=Pedobacter miscanthi TaxID=2259170 RepID=UPI001313DE74
MNIRRSTLKIFISVLLIFIAGIGQVSAQFSVTGLFTDYKGYWTSKQGAINPIWPDNKNNLLAFTFNNINFSTGVNDALLTSKLVSFTPGLYQAFPVKNIPLPGTASNFIGLGQLEDGVDNGGVYPYSVPVTVAQILTRGIRGLDMGSCITNIPSTAAPLSFNFGAITNDSQIGDGIPDILITQVAQATGALDQVYFEDGNGNLVGNKISIDQSVMPVIGTWLPDFYDPNTGVIQPGFIKTDRPIRIWAADASAFGINSSNYSQPLVLRYKLGGSSDPAFIAFNTKFISLVTANDDLAATTLNIPVNINILANDQPNNQSALSSYTVPSVSPHGTIVKNANGTITYTPNAGYYGQDIFTYTICTNINGTVTCDDAIVTVNISPDVAAPVFSSGVNLRCQSTATTSYTASSAFATSMAFAISPNNAGTVSTSAMTTSANVGTATATVTWADDYYGAATITAIAYGSNGPKSTGYNITVNQAPTLVPGSNGTQTVCAGSPIAPATFTWGGSATDVNVTNLPAGLSTSKSGKVLTISGTPTASGTYTVTTVGQTSPCGGANATGTININPIATLVKGGGPIDQTICSGTAITPITFTWGGSATDVSYTTLPAGLTAVKNNTSKVLTISGMPTANGSFSVSTSGQLSPCTPITATSNITVNPSAGLMAGGGASNQTVCEGGSITPITYTWSGSATDVVVSNLPSGLVTSKTSNVLTISGTPSSGGTFTVNTVGQTTPCTPASLSGSVSITVTPAPTANNQAFCEILNAKISDLSATGSSVKWYTQPTGGTALASTTPLTNGTYYASQTINGCESATRASVTVTIYQTPKGFNDAKTLDCTGVFSYNIQTQNINSTANGGNSVPASFTWTVNSNANVTGAANGSGSTITQTLINTSNSTQNIVYTVTPKATVTGACVGSTFTVTVTVPVCSSLSITKSANVISVNQAGNVINYSVTVANTGNTNQNNIVISDPLLGGNLSNPTKTGNADNILEKGESWTYTGSYTVMQSDLNSNGNPTNNSGKITNNASVTTTELPVAKTATADVNMVLSPSVTLVKKGTLNLNGNTISYLFTVKNTGNVTLSNLAITDNKVTGAITLGATSLMPGGSTTATATYTISAAEKAAGSVSNTATVTGKNPSNGNVSDISGTTEGNDNPTVTNTGVYAVDDEGSLNALTGGVAVNNVLVNDKLNGNQATFANVTISQISSSNPNISIDPATGKVNVLPNTPVGNYTLIYQIEDKANPGNVKQATVTVHLTTGAILAKDDAGSANSVIGGTAVADVLSNDNYNGSTTAPTLANVTITNGTNDSNGKVTLDPATGKVSVAANTPAGIYTLTYTITDKLDASKFSTATVKVTVASGAILAKDDAGSANSVTGGTAVADVLANDNYNGSTTAPTLANVTITNGTNDSNGKVTLDPATGKVNVAANTPAGIYTLTYTITDKLDASKFSTATVKVTVASGAILAKDDAGSANSVTGGTAVADVLANDNYNGSTTAPTLTNVTITNGTNDSNGKVTLDPATGKVSVAANTPAGVYTLTYTITDKLDASKFSTATVKVTVASGAILAKDDTGSANSVTGGTAVADVLANDNYNGSTAAPTLANVTITNGTNDSNGKVTLDPATGKVSVAANTPAGIYTLTYTITDKLDASKFSTATVKVTVASGAILAKDDSGSANSVTGGTAVADVLANDNYNGSTTAPTLANVTITNGTNDSNGKVTLDPATGKVSVAANTPAGIYTLTYTITDKLDASKFSTATVKVTVASGAILAKDDTGSANSVTGGTAVADVLANDNYNGSTTAPTLANVTITNGTNDSNGKVTLDPATGKVSVAANTP